MMGTTHRLGGISAGLITSSFLYAGGYTVATEHPEVLVAVIAGGVLGGLMPDIDHPNSKLSRFKLMGIPILKPIAFLIHGLFGHRGATHTIWSLILTTLPFMLAPLFMPQDAILLQLFISLFGIGYAGGYFSHLFLDSLTPSGTPMMWPLPDVHLASLPTGKYDSIVSVVLTLSTLGICGAIFYFSGY